MSALFHFQYTFNDCLTIDIRLVHLRILKGGAQIDPPPQEKTSLKKPSLIRIKSSLLQKQSS